MATYDDDYATCKATSASLRLYHTANDPREVSEALALHPTRSRRAAEAGHPSAWLLSSEDAVSSLDIRRHMDWLLATVGGTGPALEALRQRGWSTDVGCYWVSASGHGGPMLTAGELSILGELGLPLSFDLYFP